MMVNPACAPTQVLERQRFAFPEQWRYVDNLEGEWDAFMDILNRKDAQIQGQMGQLQMKVQILNYARACYFWVCCVRDTLIHDVIPNRLSTKIAISSAALSASWPIGVLVGATLCMRVCYYVCG